MHFCVMQLRQGAQEVDHQLLNSHQFQKLLKRSKDTRQMYKALLLHHEHFLERIILLRAFSMLNIVLSSCLSNQNTSTTNQAVLGRCSLSVLQTVRQVVVFGYLLGAGWCTLHTGNQKNLAHREAHPDPGKDAETSLAARSLCCCLGDIW